jgi:hypothetical protein
MNRWQTHSPVVDDYRDGNWLALDDSQWNMILRILPIARLVVGRTQNSANESIESNAEIAIIRKAGLTSGFQFPKHGSRCARLVVPG